MKTKPWLRAGVLSAGVLVVGAGLMAQSGRGARNTGAELKEWTGMPCTVYLRLESDPRAGRASFSGGSDGAIDTVENLPVAVHGTIVSVNETAIGVARGTAIAWIPRDQIRLIASTVQP